MVDRGLRLCLAELVEVRHDHTSYLFFTTNLSTLKLL